eukprot:9416005-Alexandrium_andersonii.AAC.1
MSRCRPDCRVGRREVRVHERESSCPCTGHLRLHVSRALDANFASPTRISSRSTCISRPRTPTFVSAYMTL